MRNQQIADVLDVWIADKRLARRKLAFLRSAYEQMISSGIPCNEIADSLYCEELDLPHGSSVVEVVAELLDHLEPRGGEEPSRLDEVGDLMGWRSGTK